jgi:hypothetical protein
MLRQQPHRKILLFLVPAHADVGDYLQYLLIPFHSHKRFSQTKLDRYCYYEYIEYYRFGPVEHERSLSWKAGTGRVLVGVWSARPQRTDTDQESVLIPGGRKVLVMQTEAKLVTKEV